MTAYILTPAQHSQLVDALEGTNAFVKLDEALEMLKAMKPAGPVGWWDTIDGADLTYSVGELMGGPTDGLRPLYAMETKT